MNPVLANPDIKINMSLDEIIHYTKKEINSQLNGRHIRGIRKRKKNPKSKNEQTVSTHSVPLMGITTGVDIYVSNQSPLLNLENKRRIAQAISNRALNSDLLQKSKELIQAEYKLVKTNHGFERVLVPAVNQLKPLQKKLKRPRKLKRNMEEPKQHIHSNTIPDGPPPLIAAPIFEPTKMEVDESDDEIIIIDNPLPEKQLEILDVSSDFANDILQAKRLCLSAAASMPCLRTLNDRFTMLSGSYGFK